MTTFDVAHFEVVPGFITPEEAADFAGRIRDDLPPRLDMVTDDGVERHHWVGDAHYCARVVPELLALTPRVLDTAEGVVGMPVLPSPFARSATSVKVYGPGDSHGVHSDTNSVTALLVLCGESEAACTVADGSPILNGPGGLLIMDGQVVRHGVPPLPENAPLRITVPFNLYLPWDVERAAEQDERVYGA